MVDRCRDAGHVRVANELNRSRNTQGARRRRRIYEWAATTVGPTCGWSWSVTAHVCRFVYIDYLQVTGVQPRRWRALRLRDEQKEEQ